MCPTLKPMRDIFHHSIVPDGLDAFSAHTSHTPLPTHPLTHSQCKPNGQDEGVSLPNFMMNCSGRGSYLASIEVEQPGWGRWPHQVCPILKNEGKSASSYLPYRWGFPALGLGRVNSPPHTDCRRRPGRIVARSHSGCGVVQRTQALVI